MNKRRLLIIEDERAILYGLTDLFVYHGFDVKSESDGLLGLKVATSEQFDLIILDVMLPSMDGYTICNKIREVDRTTPIIMLTAKSTEEDIIHGLTLGADDYLGKPFSARELVLRTEAILRRTIGEKERERYIELAPEIIIDTANLVSVRAPKKMTVIEFTRKEVEILKYLIKNNDRPVSRDELLQEIWGYKKGAEIETRTVDIHIAKLRKKVEDDPKNPSLLVTIRGEGYKLLGGRIFNELEK